MQKIVLLSEQFYIQLIRTFLQIRIFRAIYHQVVYTNHSFFFHGVRQLFIWLHILKKHKNHLSAITVPMLKMQKTMNNFYEKIVNIYLMQKTDFINAVSKFEYIVKMMCREQILLTQKQILSMQKNNSIIVKFKYEKTFRFGVNLDNTISLGVL